MCVIFSHTCMNYMCEIFPRQIICVNFSHKQVTFEPMDSSNSSLAGPPPALVRALRRVLRPLVRVMLARGITYPYLAELLKNLFVDVAATEFRLDNKAPTDSRISLMTGVHRKDVSRLRSELAQTVDAVPDVVSLGAQLVAVWLGTARYLHEDGSPLPLARFASEGGELSFESLVAGVNNDIRSRVVLDEWLRLGVVRLDDENRVCLNAEAFVPSEGFDEKAFYFGHNLHDHAAAAARNLLGVQPALLERSVQYDALSEASMALLAKQSREAGMKALLAVNKNALALEQADAATEAPKHRMTFGIYFYTEPMPKASSAPAGKTGAAT